MKGGSRLLPMLLFLLGAGCNKTPEGILPVDKMKVVFLHHIMADDMLNNFISRYEAINYDSARIVLYSGVMKLHKTDSATFIRSLNYYKADIGRFKELLDSVNALAIREKDNYAQVVAERLRKKMVADSIATADSLAKLKKLNPDVRDSLTTGKDSLKAAGNDTGKKADRGYKRMDSTVLPPQ
jgi:Domain of unknown function (DUF4296)